MENLQSLIDRALAEGPSKHGAMLELAQLAQKERNRAALFAHPLLIEIAVELFTRHESLPAVWFIQRVTYDRSLERKLYMRPGVVDALVRYCEQPEADAELLSSATSAISQLLVLYENKLDFVRSGYAQRLVAVVMVGEKDSVQQERLCGVLTFCLQQHRYDLDSRAEDVMYEVLRTEFSHVPGLMAMIVRVNSASDTGVLVYTLSTYKLITLDMVQFPGLVDTVVGWCRGNVHGDSDDDDILDLVLPTLVDMVEHAPVQALLVHSDVLLTTLVDIASYTEEEVAEQAMGGLVRWRVGLSSLHAKKKETAADIERTQSCTAEGREVFEFWRNVPKIWAVISTHERTRRSPLRRLPIEMFRMLKDTLCG